jgi:DNA (cytosine-5)-methyltransferase 1
MPPPKIIDLFAGAGGFSLGAHLAGFSPALAIEIDEDLGYSREINFPRSQTLYADLAILEPADALRAANLAPGRIAGIIGGPPCQGYSEMGDRNPHDERNALVTRFFHYVAVIEPAFFMMENVPGILAPDLRFHLDAGLDQVANRYEIVGPLKFDAQNFGAATTRERVVILGFRSDRIDAISENDLRAAQSEPATIADAIRDVPPPNRGERDAKGNVWAAYSQANGPLPTYAQRARRMPPRELASKEVREVHRQGRVSGFQPTAHTAAVRARFEALEPGRVDQISKYPRLRWEGICTTLRAGTGRDRGSFQAARPIHPDEPRVITVREAARIQGFPDWFQFHPTIWHSFRMIGNSVSPYMAEALLRVVAERLGE